MTAPEEFLDVEEIQGNVLAGFNKDTQVFLFLRIPQDAASIVAVRSWLGQLAPQISTVAEVSRFNRLYKALRTRSGAEPSGLAATWMNIAFSAQALRTLTSRQEVDQFGDELFRDGLSARSAGLGDPIDPQRDGHPQNWLVGGPGKEADVLVIIASDSPEMLNQRLHEFKSMLPAVVSILFEETGRTLGEPLRGHEHFGFKDGVSQPGIRGLLQGSPAEFLTSRQIDPTQSPQADPVLPEFASPGRPLVWPGQFVFGYRHQSFVDPRQPRSPPLEFANACPTWGRNGSYLVCRRLRQDVPAFRTFMRAEATKLAREPGFTGLTATRFAAMCVGRWPSGAPIMRSPTSENIQLGSDRHANNYFQFVEDSPPPLALRPEAGYRGDSFPLSRRDDRGITCPFASHIRKVNPRDSITEQGAAADTLARMVLRRGIPYGPVYPGDLEQDGSATDADARQDRGLIFVSYQTSIEQQFAFLQKSWANHPQNPNGGGGEDPIIGQGDRTAGGTRTFELRAQGQPIRPLSLPIDWVTPTGGGFFFSPSISTIATVLGRR